MKTIPSAKIVRLMIAFLIGLVAALATYHVITRPSLDNRVLSAPGSPGTPGPLF